jgi:hypothetical protein
MALGSKSYGRGQNEQMTNPSPWNVWWTGGGWWMRPTIGSKSWMLNAHG